MSMLSEIHRTAECGNACSTRFGFGPISRERQLGRKPLICGNAKRKGVARAEHGHKEISSATAGTA